MADKKPTGNKQKTKAFKRERKAQLRRLVKAHRATAKQVKELLDQTAKVMAAEIASGSLTEFQAWQLPNIKQSIDIAARELGEAMGQIGVEGAGKTHEIGVDLVDKPLAAAGIHLGQHLHEIDLKQLMGIRTFMTDRLKDVSSEIARKVNGQIGLVMIGGQGPAQAVTSIASAIKSGRGRAITILRTEMGRAFSVATQQRQAQAAELLPGLKKQWRRSGKTHSRIPHDIADGQIVAVDEPFIINGIKLMYPRDPKAPAKETINCGCVSLPQMDSWEVRNPDRLPFSDEEIYKNPTKRNLAREFNPPPEAGRVARLGNLPEDRLRSTIAEEMATPAFNRFAGRSDGPSEHWPVAALPVDVRDALGTTAQVAQLSKYTAVKQIEHRRGQNFTPADYARAQRLIDGGAMIESRANHLEFMGGADGEIWTAVLKVTSDKSEIYLQSLRRSNQRGMTKARKKGKVLREGGED